MPLFKKRANEKKTRQVVISAIRTINEQLQNFTSAMDKITEFESGVPHAQSGEDRLRGEYTSVISDGAMAFLEEGIVPPGTVELMNKSAAGFIDAICTKGIEAGMEWTINEADNIERRAKKIGGESSAIGKVIRMADYLQKLKDSPFWTDKTIYSGYVKALNDPKTLNEAAKQLTWLVTKVFLLQMCDDIVGTVPNGKTPSKDVVALKVQEYCLRMKPLNHRVDMLLRKGTGAEARAWPRERARASTNWHWQTRLYILRDRGASDALARGDPDGELRDRLATGTARMSHAAKINNILISRWASHNSTAIGKEWVELHKKASASKNIDDAKVASRMALRLYMLRTGSKVPDATFGNDAATVVDLRLNSRAHFLGRGDGVWINTYSALEGEANIRMDSNTGSAPQGILRLPPPEPYSGEDERDVWEEEGVLAEMTNTPDKDKVLPESKQPPLTSDELHKILHDLDVALEKITGKVAQ